MRPYLLPVGVSLLFIAWSPFIGPLRDAIKRVLGDSFTMVVGLLVGTTVLAALVWGVRHVRERRLQRVGLMVLALLLFVAYAVTMRTGIPDVDAVERIHFVEYGLVATLFYRAMSGMSLGAVVPMTMLAGTLVGIGEEWLQWLVPTRVGDVRDVFLNFYALGCGVLFAIGLYPKDPAGNLSTFRWRPLLGLASVVVVSFGGFFHSAHLGYELEHRAIGRFRSFFTAEQLSDVGAERVERWRSDPPTSLEPFAIQDHYLVEGASHVQHRNEFYAQGRFRESWLENAILEAYYDPLLDQRSMSGGALHRWPEAQRAEVEAKGASDVDGGYVSPVNMDRVFVSPTKIGFWTVVGAVVGSLLAGAALLGRPEAATVPRETGGDR